MANEDIVRTFYDAWNAREFERSAELMADDGELVMVGSGRTFRGPDGVIEFSRMWADAFPDGKVTIEKIIASGDTIAVEYTGRGTHTGTLASPMGDIEATGKSVTLQLCDVYELSGGKVRSNRQYFDSASLMTQLGIMPAPTEAAIS
jgi:steroid delta-isomerase-like uncharacterized protein